MLRCVFISIVTLFALVSSVDGFVTPQTSRTYHVSLSSLQQQNDEVVDCNEENIPSKQHHNNIEPQPTTNRRNAIRKSAASIAAITTGLVSTTQPQQASALPAIASFSNPFAPSALKSTNGGKYIPAKRCTAYLIDQTIPPSLIPYRASREAAILKNLGMGSGTSKTPFIEEDINLNNVLNKDYCSHKSGMGGPLVVGGDETFRRAHEEDKE